MNDCHSRGQPRKDSQVGKLVSVGVVTLTFAGAAIAHGDWIIAVLVVLGAGYALQEGA